MEESRLQALKQNQLISGIFFVFGIILYFAFVPVDIFTASCLLCCGIMCGIVFVIFSVWRFIIRHKPQ